MAYGAAYICPGILGSRNIDVAPWPLSVRTQMRYNLVEVVSLG